MKNDRKSPKNVLYPLKKLRYFVGKKYKFIEMKLTLHINRKKAITKHKINLFANLQAKTTNEMEFNKRLKIAKSILDAQCKALFAILLGKKVQMKRNAINLTDNM